MSASFVVQPHGSENSPDKLMDLATSLDRHCASCKYDGQHLAELLTNASLQHQFMPFVAPDSSFLSHLLQFIQQRC